MEVEEKALKVRRIPSWLPYVFLAYSLISYYLHAIDFWGHAIPLDWLIALVLYIELRLQKLRADILEAILPVLAKRSS